MSQRTEHSIDLAHPLVLGFGVTGEAVTRSLVARGHHPVVVDDRPTEASAALVAKLGLELVSSPDLEQLRTTVGASTVVLPSPGVPADHPIFDVAVEQSKPIRSEFDLAAAWDDRPLLGITGTNGKTTVTMLVTEALNRSGRTAAAVGNTEVPLVTALDDDAIDVFVVEASSFRLAHSAVFSPTVACWLNFSPDHLDAHPTLADYEAAKASIWSSLPSGGIAIANAEDPVVRGYAPSGAVTFGLDKGEWRREGEHLVGPDGPFVAIDDLPRRQPHDLSNAAAVAATAQAAGATLDAIAETLRTFTGLPHRLEHLTDHHGVSWYNDSKATVPHATMAAVGGFESVVLIAGGRNKGLELAPLRETVPPVRAVVATGDAGPEIAALFEDLVPVTQVQSMAEAVEVADELSCPGDTVLLSPACTSYDWYRSYVARGEDFSRLVKERLT